MAREMPNGYLGASKGTPMAWKWRSLIAAATMCGWGANASATVVEDAPEVRAAMARGDYERLMNNPKILKLLDHEAIREITRKVR